MTLITDVQHEPAKDPLLKELQSRIDTVVSQIANHAHEMRKREDHTTSQLAGAISTELARDPIEVDGLTVEVHVEEFKPHQEKNSGADLYVSVVRKDHAND
jgi:hypothetical protein